ncbi:MAG: class I SAM-dependent methyltransferase [Actinomycetota bacterium]|nr:class I SAM-dependent methyltransferase [Actinomycetota bacterium]
MAGSGSESIGPTAHYTGYVWARNGLSHPRLQTREGRVLYESLRPVMTLSGPLTGVSLERYLLARHRAIDTALEGAIDSGAVSQVIEVACGLSPRGWRFANLYGSRLTYIETDLPGMIARKREALAQIGSLSDTHRVQELDALREDGPTSLAALADALELDRGVGIITEGLLGYLDHASLIGIWERFAGVLQRFPDGRYFSDLHLGEQQTIYVRAFRTALSAFVKGRVHLHFESAAQAEDQLRASGFTGAAVHSAAELLSGAEDSGDGGARRGGGELVHIIEASTVRSQ